MSQHLKQRRLQKRNEIQAEQARQQEERKKESIFRKILMKYEEDADYLALEDFLRNENTSFAVKALVSAKIKQADWTNAALILNNIPTTTAEEAEYVWVQQLNLQRLATANFEPSEEDLAGLQSIADKQGPESAFACALLTNFTGQYCDWELWDDSGSGKQEEQPRFKTAKLLSKNELYKISVAPNPVANDAHIILPAHLPKQAAEIQIWNINGQLVKQINIAETAFSVDFSTHEFSNGVYLLQYLSNNEKISSTKLIVQH